VFEALRRHEDILEDVCGFRALKTVTARIDGQVDVVNGELITGSYYRTLGVAPAVGRPIFPGDATAGAAAVVVISDGFWSRRFGRSESVLGNTIELNGIPVTIVGVNGREFTGTTPGYRPDIFIPLTLQRAIAPHANSRNGSIIEDPGTWWISLIARMKPSVSDERALATLQPSFQSAVAASLPDQMHRDRPYLRIFDGSRGIGELRQAFSGLLQILAGVVGMVLLLASANLANLLLSRANYRRPEIGLRMALGAGRARIVRQLLAEGLVLAALGGGVGVFVGYWTRNVIPGFQFRPWDPISIEAAFNGRVLGVVAGLTLLTGILFSLAPAWHAARTSFAGMLNEGARATRPRSVGGGRALIVLQIALACVLLTGAGLLVRSLTNLYRADLGFEPDQVVLFSVGPVQDVASRAPRGELFRAVQESIRTIPGVQSVGLSTIVLVGQDTSTTRVGPDGRSPRQDEAGRTWVNDVGPGFFQTMGIRVLRGRALGDADGPTATPAIVVNEAFVRKFFPSGDALGRTVRNNIPGKGEVLFEIVGIVGNTRYRDVRSAAPPTMYRPYTQLANVNGMTFEVKTRLAEAALLSAVRESVRRVDPSLPVRDMRSQHAQIESTVSQDRLLATLVSAFGLLAVTLACIGIYGVVAQAAARRTREIGLRIALGAQRGEVLRLMLRESAASVCLGIVLGAAAFLSLGRYLSSILYGIEPLDAATLVASMLIVLLTAFAASMIPARRAARLSPTVALRHE
jgi:predicted permease